MTYEFVVTDTDGRLRAHPFPGRRFVVGAGPDCQLRLEGLGLCSAHAEVELDSEDRPWVRDLTGRGLVWINSEAISHGAIPHGAEVRLGELQLTLRARAKTSAAASAPPPRLPRTKQTPKAALLPGTAVDGRYRVLRRLAAGGMGEVYLAEHIQLGKPVALKVMLRELTCDPKFVARFKREAIAASRIGQQNIVDVFDFGQTADGSMYFVMEYLNGETLGAALRRQGAMASPRVIRVSLQIARALAAAHAQGIIHRDLKPENVMLVQRPEQRDFVKVLDFGVAKVAPPPGENGFTAVGMVMGTPRYMAPEQARALPVDARTDVYALGLIVYELLAGRAVFADGSAAALIIKQVSQPPPPLRPGPIGAVPAVLEELVFQMLQKEPGARPQTMDEVVKRLRVLEGALTPETTPEPARGPLATPAWFDLVRPTAPQLAPKPAADDGRPGDLEADEPEPEALAEPIPSTLRPVRANPMPPSTRPRTWRLADWTLERWQPGTRQLALVLAALLAVSGVALAYLLGDWPTPSGPQLGALPRPAAPSVEPAEAAEPVTDPAPNAEKVEAPPAAPRPVKLLVLSRPAGAEVYAGEQRLGRAPLDLTRDQGTSLELRLVLEGHKPQAVTAHFGPGGPRALTAQLERTPVKAAKPPPRAVNPDDPRVLK